MRNALAIAGAQSGSVTEKNVRTGLAPRLAAASAKRSLMFAMMVTVLKAMNGISFHRYTAIAPQPPVEPMIVGTSVCVATRPSE